MTRLPEDHDEDAVIVRTHSTNGGVVVRLNAGRWFGAALMIVLSSALALLAGAACADEASIRAEFLKKYPQANVESISKTPYLGLYEMVVDGEVIYTDADFNYLIVGSLIETKTKTNLTDARNREIEEKKLKSLAFPFEQLPFDLAIKKVKGTGARTMYVFSDADWPFTLL